MSPKTFLWAQIMLRIKQNTTNTNCSVLPEATCDTRDCIGKSSNLHTHTGPHSYITQMVGLKVDARRLQNEAEIKSSACFCSQNPLAGFAATKPSCDLCHRTRSRLPPFPELSGARTPAASLSPLNSVLLLRLSLKIIPSLSKFCVNPFSSKMV